MNTQQAKDIVKQLFPSSFNKSNYASFIKELLNSLDDKKRIEWSGKQVKEVYSQYISKYERIGMYTSNEGETLDVLIVYLSSTATLLEQERLYVILYLIIYCLEVVTQVLPW